MSTLKKIALASAFIALIATVAIMMGAARTTSAAALKIGDKAPDFTLTDLDGNKHTLSDYTKDGKIVVLEWFSPSCPFVRKHYRSDTGTMTKIQADHADDNIVWLRINSAYGQHPTADLKLNRDTAKDWNITTPILMDTTGKVGKSYNAKRTPDMYIINADQTLAYQGGIDNRSDAAAPGDVNYVANALTELLAGKAVTKSETKSYGCGIKYD